MANQGEEATDTGTTADGTAEGATRTVLFVCPRGAGKSRMAAAYFAAAAPRGWEATTAGPHPADAVSPAAVRLLAGSPEDASLDRAAPRPLTALLRPDLVVSIDCDAAAGMAGGGDAARHLRWELAARTMDESMRDELRARVLDLAAHLRDTGELGDARGARGARHDGAYERGN